MILAAEMMYKDLPMKFIREWVEWHSYLGFDRLFILDHFSKERLVYDHPKVQVFHADKEKIEAYPHCKDAKYKYFAMSWWWDHLINYEEWDWMAFIDSDEFVMLPQRFSLKNTLLSTEGDAVALNWKNFGPADYEKDPPGRSLFAYEECLHHHSTKVIAKKSALVKHYNDVQNCHMPALKKQAKLVSSSGKELKHECYSLESGLADWDNIWINHYHLRSREDWHRKQEAMKDTKDEMPWYWEEEHFQGCRETSHVDRTAFGHEHTFRHDTNYSHAAGEG